MTAIGLIACSADTMTAPKPACANALVPPTFRLVMGTLEKRDTLSPRLNRYVVPLRNADTVIYRFNDNSGSVGFIYGGTPGYCITLRDSLEIHPMPELWTILSP